MAERSLRFSIYLLKAEVREYHDALEEDYQNTLFVAPVIEGIITEANPAFYWQQTESRRLPKWHELMSQGFVIPADRLYSTNKSGVLFLTANERKFAITFGYGHNFLREDVKVRDFGLKTALGAMDEESIKDLEFSTPEAQPYQTKKQTGKGGAILGFGISDVYDIIKFASGRASRDAGELGSSSVGGNDALKFNSKCDFNELPQKCARALQIYNERWYATRKNFAFIDYIRHEKDPNITKRLDDMLCRAFVADPELIFLAPPEIINDEVVTGYRYTRTQRGVRYDELQVTDYIATHGDVHEITLEKLKSDKVVVCYSDDDKESWPKWSVYKTIIFEPVDATGQRYILFEGAWYNIDTAFQRSVEEYYDRHLVALDFPDCMPGSAERQVYEPESVYNARVAASRGYVLLDADLIQSEMGRHEACDLVGLDGVMYHVKRKNTSGQSHLFRQGDFSSQMLASNSMFRANTLERIRELSPDHPCDFDGETPPINLTVHFVILAAPLQRGAVEFDMPFFSKVAFKMAGEKIQSRRHNVLLSFVRQQLQVRENMLDAVTAVAVQ